MGCSTTKSMDENKPHKVKSIENHMLIPQNYEQDPKIGKDYIE